MRVDRAVRRCAVVLAVLFAAWAPTAAAAAAPSTAAQPQEAAPSHDGTELEEAGRPEPVTEAERAAALAEPAIVLIEVRWEGHVYDRLTGEIVDSEPVSASVQCTGAGVGHEGYLLTTRSCLDQSAIAVEAFRQLVDRRMADGTTPASDADVLLAELVLNATIGPNPDDDDPAERTVSVRRAVTDDEPMPATVVSVADPSDGDAALIKISRSNQPVLPLADDADLEIGTELVTVECPPMAGGMVGVAATSGPEGDPDEVEPVRPRFRTGTVLDNSPQVLVEPSEPAQGVASGVVLTHDAAIAGLVAARLPAGDLLVDLSVIRGLLAHAQVEPELSQVDRDYRAGLDAYYAGQYGDAIGRFDAVLAIIPAHVQAHEYRDAAQSLRDADGGEEPAPTDQVVEQVESWLNGRSWSLVGLIVLLAIVVFIAHRRRPLIADVTEPARNGGADAGARDSDQADAAVVAAGDADRTDPTQRAGQPGR